MTEPIDPPEGEVEGPTEPVPGGQPEGEPQPWMPMPGTYGSRNAGRRISILEQLGSALVTRPVLRDALEDADGEFQQALAAGRALVDEAQQHADDALGAAANAGSILDTVQGTGADVVAKHTEVLTLHGQAITAASNAAGDAALAAAKALEASDHAADALIVFEAQQAQIDAEQNARLDMHEMMIDALRQAQRGGLLAQQGRLVKASTAARSDGFVSIDSGGTTQDVTALGTWTGTIHAEYGRNRGANDSFAVQKREWQVPGIGGGRTYTFPWFGYNSASDFQYLDLSYSVNPGTQHTRDQAGGSFPVPQESWTTVTGQNWTVPAGASSVAVWFKTGWDAVPFLPTYQMRILVNGIQVAYSSKNNWGPLFGNSYRANSVSYNAGVAPGSTVSFQVWTNAAIEHERVVRDTETKISWIEGA